VLEETTQEKNVILTNHDNSYKQTAQISVLDSSIDTMIRKFEKKLSRELRNEIKSLVQAKLNQILTHKKSFENSSQASGRTLDQEIDVELTQLFSQFRTELKDELRQEIKFKIVRLLKKYAYKMKEIKPTFKQDKLIVKKIVTHKAKQQNRKKSPLHSIVQKQFRRTRHQHKKIYKTIIKSIVIGQDKRKEKVSNATSLPIVVTVVSPYRLKGKLQFFAKDIKSKKSYLIYELEPFRLNLSWAQDQYIWNGTYYSAGKKQNLPSGQYQVFTILTFKKAKWKKAKKIVRYWGYGRKGYYITVAK